MLLRLERDSLQARRVIIWSMPASQGAAAPPEVFPRKLSRRERGLIDYLLAAPVPEAEALRHQARSLVVRGLYAGLPSSVLLQVTDAAAPPARTAPRMPVEAAVKSNDQLQVLLFLNDRGLIDWLQAIDLATDHADALPRVADLEPPVVNRR